MKIRIKLNSLTNSIFIALTLFLNFNFANTSQKSASDSKANTTEINNLNEKIDLEKKKNVIKNNSDNNFHEIMSTKGGCAASCCANKNTVQNIDNSKNKLNSQKSKKKFGWFSRSK